MPILEDELQAEPKPPCRPAPETTDGETGARLKRSPTLCPKVRALALDCSGLYLAYQQSQRGGIQPRVSGYYHHLAGTVRCAVPARVRSLSRLRAENPQRVGPAKAALDSAAGN
jgi:hypothetical protein